MNYVLTSERPLTEARQITVVTYGNASSDQRSARSKCQAWRDVLYDIDPRPGLRDHLPVERQFVSSIEGGSGSVGDHADIDFVFRKRDEVEGPKIISFRLRGLKQNEVLSGVSNWFYDMFRVSFYYEHYDCTACVFNIY